MNKCFFIGRLTRDPESQFTASGKAICNFSIAVNEGKDANGNDRVVFVDFEAWEGTAEFVMKHFTKGKPIVVDSRMKIDTWDDKTTGERRSKAKFVVKEVNFVPSSPSQASGSDNAQVSTTPEPAKKTRKSRTPVAVTVEAPTSETGFTSEEDDDDDIPF